MGATPPLWIPAFAGMTNSVAGAIYFPSNDEVGGGYDVVSGGNLFS